MNAQEKLIDKSKPVIVLVCVSLFNEAQHRSYLKRSLFPIPTGGKGGE